MYHTNANAKVKRSLVVCIIFWNSKYQKEKSLGVCDIFENREGEMEIMSRRKVRLYLFSLILAALLMGTAYYMHQMDRAEVSAEGTLI